jgi:hypothetical protein
MVRFCCCLCFNVQNTTWWSFGVATRCACVVVTLLPSAACFPLADYMACLRADFSVFVGDLAPDVTDYVLQETFRQYYPSVRSAKVIRATNYCQCAVIASTCSHMCSCSAASALLGSRCNVSVPST